MQEKVIQACDKVTLFAFYAIVFSIPVAASFIEGFFALIILSYVIKRTIIFSGLSKTQALTQRFRKAYRPVTNPLNKPIGLYTFIAFISIFVSYYPHHSIKAFIFRLLQATFTYFLFIETINSQKRVKVVLALLVASITLTVSNGIFQYFARIEYIRHHPINDGRVTSTFSHANNLAAYLMMLLPFLFSLTSFYKQKQKPAGRKETWGLFRTPRGIYFINVLFILTIVCIGLTYSRAAWILCSLCLIALYARTPKRLSIIVVLISLFLGLFVVKMFAERTTNIFDPSEGIFAIGKRIIYWREAVLIINDHPVFGTGLNTYSLIARNYKIWWGGYPHNCYLHMAAEIGLFGITAFLWIIYKLYNYVIASLKAIHNAFSYRILLGLLLGMSAFLVHSFFDTNLYSIRLEALFWVVIALMVSVVRVELK